MRKIRNAGVLVSLFIKRKIRMLAGRKIVNVIGDSHALAFQNENFQINYIGAATAYNLASKKSSTGSYDKILKILKKIPSGTVLLVFGEIDCRIHIYSQHKKKNKPIKYVIEETVKSYISFVKLLQRDFKNLQISVLCVLPQGVQGNYFKKKYYAMRDTRVEITEKFNKELLRQCKNNKIEFIDIYPELIDKKKNRIEKYVFDEIHFNNKIVPFVLWQLKKRNLH